MAGIPLKDSNDEFIFYVIPSLEMAPNVKEQHAIWLAAVGKDGKPHKDNSMRTIELPPRKISNGWDITQYKNNWKIIEELLT